MLSVLSAVSIYASIWITWLCINCIYAKPACILMKHTKFVENQVYSCKPECTSVLHVNKRCMHAVRVNHDAHSS